MHIAYQETDIKTYYEIYYMTEKSTTLAFIQLFILVMQTVLTIHISILVTDRKSIKSNLTLQYTQLKVVLNNILTNFGSSFH